MHESNIAFANLSATPYLTFAGIISKNLSQTLLGLPITTPSVAFEQWQLVMFVPVFESYFLNPSQRTCGQGSSLRGCSSTKFASFFLDTSSPGCENGPLSNAVFSVRNITFLGILPLCHRNHAITVHQSNARFATRTVCTSCPDRDLLCNDPSPGHA